MYIDGTKNSYHMYLAVNIMKMVESSDAEWSSYTMIILHLGKGHVHDQSNVLCDMIKLFPIAVNPLYGNIKCRGWQIFQLFYFVRIQIFIAILETSMKNAFRLVQTCLVWC